MRTLLFILTGLLLWGITLAAARLVSTRDQPAMQRATHVFVVLWFAAAAANMWVGVVEAGYSFMEELPIFLLIFAVPVAVALFVNRTYLQNIRV